MEPEPKPPILDYLSPRPPLRKRFWSAALARFIRRKGVRLWISLCIISAPILLLLVVIDYPYGVVGIFAMLLIAGLAGKWLGTRAKYVLIASILAGLAVTIELHMLSTNVVVIRNETNQRISGFEIEFSNPNHDSSVLSLGPIPPRAIISFSFHDLFCQGLMTATGQLQDGTPLKTLRWQAQALSGNYHGRAVLILNKDGSVRLLYE